MTRLRWPRRAASIAASLAFLGCAPPRSEPGRPASGPVRETIIAIERGAWEAWQRKDASYFRNTLMPDAAYVSAVGVNNREEIAKQIETDACKVDGFTLRNEQVRSLSPDVALLTLRATSNVTCASGPVHSDVWSSTLFVRDGDAWRVAGHQETDAQR